MKSPSAKHPWRESVTENHSPVQNESAEHDRLRGLRNRMRHTVAGNIASLRAACGADLSQMARHTGLAKTFLYMVERNQVRPGDESLIKIADYFGVRVGDLYRRRD